MPQPGGQVEAAEDGGVRLGGRPRHDSDAQHVGPGGDRAGPGEVAYGLNPGGVGSGAEGSFVW